MADAVKKANGLSSNGVKSTNGRLKTFVSVDTTVEQVLKLDTEGHVLVFSGDPSRFVELSPAQVLKLSVENRQRYGYAKEEHEYLKQEGDSSAFVGAFEIDPARAGANSRLDINRKDPNYDYFWKAPENVAGFLANGGEVVPARGKEQTLAGASAKSGAHEISNQGRTELVLCRMPKQRMAQMEAEGKRRYAKLMQQGSRDFADLVAEAKAEVVESRED